MGIGARRGARASKARVFSRLKGPGRVRTRERERKAREKAALSPRKGRGKRPGGGRRADKGEKHGGFSGIVSADGMRAGHRPRLCQRNKRQERGGAGESRKAILQRETRDDEREGNEGRA